jgi:hypothetical protein
MADTCGLPVLRQYPIAPVFSDFTDMRVSESEMKMQHFPFHFALLRLSRSSLTAASKENALEG